MAAHSAARYVTAPQSKRRLAGRPAEKSEFGGVAAGERQQPRELGPCERRGRVERATRHAAVDDFLQAEPSRRPDPGEPILGWELQLVAELADRWGVRHDTRTTLWLELDL